MKSLEQSAKNSTRGITDGRKRRGAESRAKILSHAVQIASNEGLEGLTIGRLADGLHIGKSNIMVLFTNKETLQKETLDAAAQIFVESIVTPALRAKTPLAHLKMLCNGWFDYVDRRVLPGGCMMYATANEYRARPGTICERAYYHFRRWENLLHETVAAARRSGEFPPTCNSTRLVVDLMSFQAIANLVSLHGDRRAFLCARQSSRDRIEGARET